jgi:peptide/nickel transport system substrate-binding protein
MRDPSQRSLPSIPPLNRRQFMALTGAGSVAALLAACAPPGVEPATGGSAPAEGTTPAEETSSGPKTLVWMGHQEVAGLGPNDMGATVQNVLIWAIHNQLVYFNEQNELVNDLAETVEVQPDGLQYTFTLRQGVKFHDGTELTAKDVKYTFDFYRDPANATTIQSWFTGVESVETPDDYTVVVTMNSVNAASLADWGGVPIVQSAYHAEVGDATYSTAPIGTGAFKLKEWRAAEYTELEAFPDHYRGAPKVDILRLEVVPDATVRRAALETGDADSSVWPLLVEDSLALRENPDYKVYAYPGSSIKFFPINNDLPFFSDKRCRQALMYALDRQRIIDDLWNGAAEVAHSHLTPSSPYYNPNLKRYEYDPERAKELLDEAGWLVGADGIREKDGVRFSFTCTTITGDQPRKAIAELAQQLFKEVGVEMLLAEAPVATILAGLPAGELDCAIFNWTHGTALEPNPISTLSSTGANNFGRFRNEEMDELIVQGLQVVDPAERMPIYHRIQEIFVEEVPVLYLQFDLWMVPFRTTVQGLPDDILNADPIHGNQAYLLDKAG